MPRGVTILATALALAGALAIAQPAAATTYCVGVADPGCTALGDVQAALDAAAADTAPSSLVEISEGTVPEDNLQYPGPAHPGHTVEIVGSSHTPTILTHSSGDPHPGFDCVAGAVTLHDLQVRTPNGSTFPAITGQAGCTLNLDGVIVDAMLGTGDGVDLLGGGTIQDSSVAAVGGAAVPVALAVGATQPTMIADTTISGGNALIDSGSGTVTASRLTITSTGAGNAAVTARASSANATLTIDDSLIRTSASAQALFATSTGANHTAGIGARQITAAVDDEAAALPFHVTSTAGTATMTVSDSIASGYSLGVRLDGGGTAANMDLHHSVLTAPGSPSVKTGTSTYSHNDDVLDIATHPPLFVDAPAGNFHLGTGSTLIDEDATVLAAGESPTDVLGHPRIVNGRRDLGAIEHQPATATATAPASGKIGQAIAFSGSAASDAGPPEVTWDFGDGLHATGLTSTHTYAQPGLYHWSMNVSDGAGNAPPVSVPGTIVVSAQPPSVDTLGVDQVSATGALLHGTVDPGGGPTAYYFEFGPTATYGQKTPAVTAGTGFGPVAVSAGIGGLTPDTLYHERLVAMQAATVVYGADQTFTTAVGPIANGTGTTTKKTTASTARCRVPHLVGKTLRQAHSLLVRAHCILGKVTHRHVKRHRNRVLHQSRPAGKTYARNTRVPITVGRK